MDIEDASDYYADEGGPDLAQRFIDGLEAAFRAIGERPGMGSPAYARQLEVANLRTRRVHRFPYLVFYIEGPDEIDVWRVLHVRRDIPKSLQEVE